MDFTHISYVLDSVRYPKGQTLGRKIRLFHFMGFPVDIYKKRAIVKNKNRFLNIVNIRNVKSHKL